MNAPETTSTRPYLIRALYEWCSDNGLTPYVAVSVDATVQVPQEFVNNGEIVLNISMDATSALQLGNEFIEFKARFGGKPREIFVPIGRVIAIYARENGQGMAFPLEAAAPAEPPVPVLTEVGVEASADEPAAPVAKPAKTPRVPKALKSLGSVPGAAEAKAGGAGKERAAKPTEDRVIQLVTSESASSAGAGSDNEPTPPASGAGKTRPALKRIK